MENIDLINGLFIGSVLGLLYSCIIRNEDLMDYYSIIFVTFSLNILLMNILVKRYLPNMDELKGILIVFFIPIIILRIGKN